MFCPVRPKMWALTLPAAVFPNRRCGLHHGEFFSRKNIPPLAFFLSCSHPHVHATGGDGRAPGQTRPQQRRGDAGGTSPAGGVVTGRQEQWNKRPHRVCARQAVSAGKGGRGGGRMGGVGAWFTMNALRVRLRRVFRRQFAAIISPLVSLSPVLSKNYSANFERSRQNASRMQGCRFCAALSRHPHNFGPGYGKNDTLRVLREIIESSVGLNLLYAKDQRKKTGSCWTKLNNTATSTFVCCGNKIPRPPSV